MSALGGNLKESEKIDLTATVIGVCKGKALSRKGAQVGDRVVIFGELGEFWAGYFMSTRSLQVSTEDQTLLLGNLLTPTPRIAAGSALHHAGALHACTDNSDGLFPSVLSLCQTNRLGARLKFDDIRFKAAVQRVAFQMGVDPIRFALGWGDWQLVTAVSPHQMSEAYEISQELNLDMHDIGEFVAAADASGECRVELVYADQVGLLMPLDSQRFAHDSWFKIGVESYADRMINDDLATN
jgi:thiamine-monophosphate kinase